MGGRCHICRILLSLLFGRLGRDFSLVFSSLDVNKLGLNTTVLMSFDLRSEIRDVTCFSLKNKMMMMKMMMQVTIMLMITPMQVMILMMMQR